MEPTENIQLSPLMEPGPVAFSMDTIGWKILFVLLLIIIMYSVYKFYLHYKHNKYRRTAVAKIIEISQLPDNELPSIITQIMFQIKQTALQTYGREKVAALQGDQWLQFLEETANGVRFLVYKEGIMNSVYKGEISSEVVFDKNDFVKNSIKWIKSHA
jgi:hypothetical protein